LDVRGQRVDGKGARNGVIVPSSNARILYVASDVRSGSTLLDLLLGGHDSVESVGELQFVKSHYRREGTGYSWDWVCTCGKHLDLCPFWSALNGEIVEETGRELSETETWVRECAPWFPLLLLPRGWLRHLGAIVPGIRHGLEVGKNCWRIVEKVRQLSGCGVILDSSKNGEQLRFMEMERADGVYAIYLVRDGRGVAYSKMTRVGDSVWRASRKWVLENLKIILMMAILPKRQRYFLRYEDLCKSPQEEVRKILEWMSLGGGDVTLSKHDRHNVCGSPHRFDKNTAEVRLDDRWRKGLSRTDRLIFFLVGGWLNFFLQSVGF